MMSNKLNVHQRLAAAMAEVTYIQKEAKHGMKYTIVSHDAVTAKVRPVLLRHGIVYYPVEMAHENNGNRAEVQLSVRFVNIDDAADYFDVASLGYGIDPQDKGPGKAISYAVKYALLKAMGLETGDDADHDDIPHVNADQQEKEARAAALKEAMKAEARAGAEAFVSTFETKIKNLTDTPEAGALIQKCKNSIADLEKGFPDLFKRIEIAAKNAGAPMRETA
jgi:hypothetical protein